jgi:hypothetical protein
MLNQADETDRAEGQLAYQRYHDVIQMFADHHHTRRSEALQMTLDKKGLEIAEGYLRNGGSFNEAVKVYLQATGAVLVPEEPTEAMNSAGLAYMHSGKPTGVLWEDDKAALDATFGNIYRAMIKESQEG